MRFKLTPKQLASAPSGYGQMYMDSRANPPAQSPPQYTMGGTSNFNESAGGGVRFNGNGSVYNPNADELRKPSVLFAGKRPMASDEVRNNNIAIDQRRVAEGGEDFGVTDFGQLTDEQRKVVRGYRQGARTPKQLATAKADQARKSRPAGAPAVNLPPVPVKQFAVTPQQAPVQAITNRGGNARAGALRSAAADSSRSRIAAQNQGA